MKTNIIIFLSLFHFVFSDQKLFSPSKSLTIPLKKLSLNESETQELIYLLNLSHNQIKYPSFLEVKSKVHLKNYSNTQFVGEVGIGTPPQWLDVIFDTGSGNFFINSKLCTEKSCLLRASYDHDSSKTYEEIGFLIEVEFGTGSITGLINQDTISIAGIEIPYQKFAEVTDEDGDVFYDGKFSGILGLAFDSMAAFGTVPVFDNLIRSHNLKWNVFSFYYSLGDDDSEVMVGNVNPDKFQGEITWIPILKDLMNYWLIDVDDILLGSQSLGYCKHKCKAVVDTGTTLLSAPTNHLNDLLSHFNEDCSDFRNYPDIVFVIQGKEFAIPATNYILTSSKNSYDDPGVHSFDFNDCSLAFMALDVLPPNGPLWVLGDIFLSSYYSVFDRDSLSVGLAKAKHGHK